MSIKTNNQRDGVLFLKGNEAAIHGALLAGCRCFFGYPITPASEIAHTAATMFPATGGVFLQAESEIAAIQMIYGSASAGVRSLTASSSPGVSLKQEGLSYAAGAELPLVLIDIMRGGPGLGNIAPEQSDYFQMVKGGGHGNYQLPVLAPNSAQEMCDHTMDAFDLADRYRTPAVVLTDGLIGQMKEPVELPDAIAKLPDKSWRVDGSADSRANLICSIFLSPPELEEHVLKLYEKFAVIEREETRWEEFETDDADILLIGYGVVSRILHGVVTAARRRGLKVGLIRPVTLWPFPSAVIRHRAEKAKHVLVVELSMGQMVEDVRLAIEGKTPVEFYGKVGGVLPTEREIMAQLDQILGIEQELEVLS